MSHRKRTQLEWIKSRHRKFRSPKFKMKEPLTNRTMMNSCGRCEASQRSPKNMTKSVPSNSKTRTPKARVNVRTFAHFCRWGTRCWNAVEPSQRTITASKSWVIRYASDIWPNLVTNFFHFTARIKKWRNKQVHLGCHHEVDHQSYVEGTGLHCNDRKGSSGTIMRNIMRYEYDDTHDKDALTSANFCQVSHFAGTLRLPDPVSQRT